MNSIYEWLQGPFHRLFKKKLKFLHRLFSIFFFHGQIIQNHILRCKSVSSAVSLICVLQSYVWNNEFGSHYVQKTCLSLTAPLWDGVWPQATPDLSGSLRLDEVLVDLLGFVGHLHWVLGLLEVLAGHPELDVLVAELRLQEAAEGSQAIWLERGRGCSFYRKVTAHLKGQTFHAALEDYFH